MDFEKIVIEAISDMFARSACYKQRLKCECERPMPGVFDDMFFTSCQGCGRLLSMRRLYECTR